jgi:Xaa-Pro aminopeptidase
VVVHPIEFSGKWHEAKLLDLRNDLDEVSAAAMVVSEPDEIAWLFNLRGEGDRF